MRSGTRPTACSRSTWRAGPAARSTSVTDEEIVDGIRLLAETTGIFTETAGGVTTAVLAKLAERGDIGADDRVVLYITGEGLKTLDAVRDIVSTYDVEPTLDSFNETVPVAGRGAGVAVAVTVKIPAQLRTLTGNEAETEVEGASVGEALEALYERYDGLRDRITENGELRRFVNVYVGGEDIRFGNGLDTPVSDGDEITILPAVAGGAS